MKKIALIFTVFIGLATTESIAQTTFEVRYQTAAPIGDLSKDVSKYSWRGMGMDYEYFLTDNISVGAGFSWTVFHDSGSKSELHEGEIDGVDITLRGKKYDYINSVPFMGTITLHVGDDFGLVRPFFGLGIGGTWIENRVDIGLFTDVEKNVHFNLNPRVGLDIPAGNILFVPSISYNLAPGVNDTYAYQYLNVSIGLKFM